MAPCGDELVFVDDTLVLHAAWPIDELVPSRYRPPVLLVGEERWVLLSVAGTPRRPIYTLRREVPSLYEMAGKEIGYDEDRHLERRRERGRTAVAWFLWIPSVPLLPVLGLLPEGAKEKLIHLGIDPARATRLSLTIEWLLLALLVIAYPFTGGFFSPLGAVIGALAFFVMTDIAYRVSADLDGRAPGAFVGLIAEIGRWIRSMREPPLPLDTVPPPLPGAASPEAPALSDADRQRPPLE